MKQLFVRQSILFVSESLPFHPTTNNRDPVEAVLAAAAAEGKAIVTDQAERLAGLTGMAINYLRMVRTTGCSSALAPRLSAIINQPIPSLHRPTD
jgi:hypothetical protein